MKFYGFMARTIKSGHILQDYILRFNCKNAAAQNNLSQEIAGKRAIS